MNYQRKEELENDFIETNGQHPLWVYRRQTRGKKNISYEKFLEQATGSSIVQEETQLLVIVSDQKFPWMMWDSSRIQVIWMTSSGSAIFIRQFDDLRLSVG